MLKCAPLSAGSNDISNNKILCFANKNLLPLVTYDMGPSEDEIHHIFAKKF